MLRVNSASVLFVPPFECAWLSELKVEEGGGCLSFEAKGAIHFTTSVWSCWNCHSGTGLSFCCVTGETDVTVLFASAPGSRRWQHTAGPGSMQDCSYTVILGSHRNRCLKIERNGQTCAQAR